MRVKTYVVYLTGARATDSVGHTDTVDTSLIDGGVEGEDITQVRSEGVFAGDWIFVSIDFSWGVHVGCESTYSEPRDPSP